MTPRARAGLGWALAVAAALAFLASRLSVDSDFAAFLPGGASAQERFLASELKDGVTSRLLLIELSNDRAESLADSSRALARTLGSDARFRYVNNGDAELGRRELDVLRAHRYQLSNAITPERFGVEGLRTALQAQVRSLSEGAGMFTKALLPEDPTGETLHLIEQLAPAKSPRRVHGVWFDATGTRALLLAETRAAGSDLNGAAEAIAALERAIATVRADRDVRIRYSSPGAMAVASRALIAADASRLAIVSSVLVVAILAIVYRNALIVLLCAIPALTGLLIGVAAVDLAFGGVHAITLGFGATLLGEAVDYPGYLLTQMGPDETAPAGLARLARTMAMAVLTTAAAATALLLADFPGLAQLGVLTMVGVLGAGIVTAWVLPHWVPRRWRPTPARGKIWTWRIALPSTARYLLAGALVAGLAAFAFARPWWDDDLANMNPLPDAAKEIDRELRAQSGAPEVRYMLLVDGATRDDAIAGAERLRPVLERAVATRALGSFELVSDYLPSLTTLQRRRASLPDAARLRADFARAASGLPLRIEAFDPFFAAIEAARVAPPLDAGALAGTAFGLRQESMLRGDGARWYVVVPLSGVAIASDGSPILERADLAGARWVDLRAASRELMATFRGNALRAFGIGALLIVAVLAIGLHDAGATARIAIPVVAAVVATAATMVAMGQPLSVFHLVALMLVAGIGTNYALFIVRGAAAGEMHATLARSLAVVGGTTLCAFGTLATSQTPVLHTIGLTVTVGVVLSLVLSVLLAVPRQHRSRDA